MISVSQFKKVLENKPQEIARMVRVLPYMIEQEIKTTNNKKVIIGLEKTWANEYLNSKPKG